MDGLPRHLNYSNVIATLALVVAVAGSTTAIAVSKGGKQADVNKKGNIRAGRVTTPKLADGAVTAPKVAAGNVTAAQLAGIHRVEATSSGRADAVCPAGERLLSGGAVPVPPAQTLQFSAPSDPSVSASGWSASALGGPVTVVALCLQATAGG